MVVFRISREKEFAPPDWRRARLYAAEAIELVAALNLVQAGQATEPPTENEGPWPFDPRHAGGLPAMADAAEWLMMTIRDDLRGRNKGAWLSGVLADLLKTGMSGQFCDAVAEYVQGGSS